MSEQPEISDVLYLDVDESLHLTQLDPKSHLKFELANVGAMCCAAAITETNDRVKPATPEFVLAILCAHSARFIRAAVNLYYLGYYPAGDGVLRAAFESAAYAVLFRKHSHAIAECLRAEFHPRLDQYEAQKDWWKAAKAAFLDWATINIKIDRQKIEEIWKTGSDELHFSFESLANDFGVTMDYLIPDDIADLVAQEEDLGDALDAAVESAKELAEWKRKFTDSKFVVGLLKSTQPGDSDESEIPPIEMYGEYNESRLTDGADRCLYLCQCLYDCAITFLPVSSEAQTRHEEWLEELRRAE